MSKYIGIFMESYRQNDRKIFFLNDARKRTSNLIMQKLTLFDSIMQQANLIYFITH